MKLPFIAIQTADNQNEIAQYLDNHNLQVLRHFEEKALVFAVERLIKPDRYDETLAIIDAILADEEK